MSSLDVETLESEPVSRDMQYTSGIKRAAQLYLALAVVGDSAKNKRVKDYCKDRLLIREDDFDIARMRAKYTGRLIPRLMHVELAAGAFPLTEQEQATVDLVQTVVEHDRTMYDATEPLAFDIYAESRKV